MANIDIEVAGRRYNVACRDGEEQHLHSVAAMVDKRARDATDAIGSLTETRQLLFAALLMADDIKEMRAGAGIADPAPPPPDPAVAQALERLAARMESLADTLEQSGASA
ncbi:MAG TPA: cell division protein ZapA [Allosphingosinicella sp.]|jgi:cell division protein ZapA|nr:cell division protein ZapA [Allosphingosinicella sp.]